MPLKRARLSQRRRILRSTRRIQSALDLCNPGHAVVLQAEGPNASFVSAPLILPSGVTLFVARGVTLSASRNRRDYDIAPGGCGALPKDKEATCKPFIFAYQAAFSGVAGEGTIDGAGAAPELISSYESQGFRPPALRCATLRVSPLRSTKPRRSPPRASRSILPGVPDNTGLLLE